MIVDWRQGCEAHSNKSPIDNLQSTTKSTIKDHQNRQLSDWPSNEAEEVG